jgi:hypothetical protein
MEEPWGWRVMGGWVDSVWWIERELTWTGAGGSGGLDSALL